MKTILIVDDDIHIGNALEEALRQEGYGVLRAYSGTEAIMVLDRSKPDLVLLDLMLPGLNGEEVLPLIQGRPVIVLSAKGELENKVQLLQGGAADYVTKPFPPRSCWRASRHSSEPTRRRQTGTSSPLGISGSPTTSIQRM